MSLDYGIYEILCMCYTVPQMAPSALLREARQAAGMTQAQLAERLGTSQPVVARLERRNANPTWETLVRALRATGHDVRLAPLPTPPVGIDLGQVRERLAMSPGERLRTFQDSQRSLDSLRAKARRAAR